MPSFAIDLYPLILHDSRIFYTGNENAQLIDCLLYLHLVLSWQPQRLVPSHLSDYSLNCEQRNLRGKNPANAMKNNLPVCTRWFYQKLLDPASFFFFSTNEIKNRWAPAGTDQPASPMDLPVLDYPGWLFNLFSLHFACLPFKTLLAIPGITGCSRVTPRGNPRHPRQGHPCNDPDSQCWHHSRG